MYIACKNSIFDNKTRLICKTFSDNKTIHQKSVVAIDIARTCELDQVLCVQVIVPRT